MCPVWLKDKQNVRISVAVLYCCMMVHCKEIRCPRLFGNVLTYLVKSGKNDFICNGLDSMQSQAFAIQTGHKNVSQSVPNLIKKSQNGDGDQVTWYNALSSYV